jgi:predicted glutamine amidotransferase
MCVILSIFQKEKNKKLVEKIVSGIENLKEINKDGVGVVAFSFANSTKTFFKRKKEIKEKELFEILRSCDIVNVHLRQATTGKIDEDNVHFWRYSDWFFAHNGIVSEFAFQKQHCDSLLFFDALIKKGAIQRKGRINFLKIKELVEKFRLFGRFVLIDNNLKRIYYFGDFRATLLNKKNLIIASKSFDIQDDFSFYGLNFKNKINKTEQEVSGIFYFDIPKKNFVFIEKDFLKNSYNNYYSNYWLNNYYYDF